MIDWVTLFISATVGGAAVVLLLQKNLLYAAIMLMLALLGTAALIIIMNAEFVAVTQIVVYVGGVLVLIIFGILLTSRGKDKPVYTTDYRMATSLLLGGIFFYLLITFIGSEIDKTDNNLIENSNTVQQIGVNLMSENILVFELIAVLLLITLIGAAKIAEETKE